MSCQSGGMDINQQHQLEHFGFSAKLNVYVVNEDEEEDETEVKDYGPILECFRDVKELNQLLPQNIEVVSVTQEQIAWRVSSQEALTKWFETNRKLSNLLTEFAVKRGLVKRLNLQTGYRLDFDIVSPDARELKIKAKKHFQEVRSSLAKGPNGEPSLNPALSKPLTTVTETPVTPTHSEVTAIVPNQESSSSIPDTELSDVSGAHSGGSDKDVLATNTQLCHDDSLPTTMQAKVDMKALKPGNICKETEAKLPYSTETDSHKMTTPPLPDVADSSSVDFDVCGGQTTISGREQSKVSSTEVILYVPEEYSASRVKMEYTFSGNKKRTVVKMEYDKESKLWFSEKIQCPLDTTFSYGFDIFKRLDMISPSYYDKDFTRCPHLTSVIRTLKGSSYLIEEGCTSHLHHIASGRSCVSIGGNLIEVDNLCKLANLDVDKKNGIFTRFTSLLEKPLKQSKVLAILAYLIGKWDIHHQTLITCSVSPLVVLSSFMIFRPDVLSRQQLKVLQCSALKVCRAAFQEAACVLLMMKYCLHLFPCSYFIRLQKENKFTFSSRDTDTDFDLHEELFHKLACVVSQENADSESSLQLFDLFIEYINVFHVLKFCFEKYPNLMERIQRLISNSVMIELQGIKSNRNWNKLREVCEVVSKHPSLVDIYSADLTDITFGMMRPLGGHTTLPGATLKKILMSEALFVQRHEKRDIDNNRQQIPM